MRRLFPLAIALSLLACPSVGRAVAGHSAPAGGCWPARAPLPLDLYGGSATSDGTYAYVAGGYSFSTGQNLDSLYRFDSASNTWTTLAPMPQAALMPSAVYFPPSNKIYVFGGEDGALGTNYAITRIYDVASDTWSTGSDMPDVRSFMASAYNPIDQKIYLVGGYNTGQVTSAQSQVWVYDPVSDTFDASRTPMPHAVGGAAFGLRNQSFYLAGGRDANQVVNDTWEYHIDSDHWNVLALLPAPTNVPGSAMVSFGRLFVYGGGNPFVAEPWASASTFIYDPVLNSWSVLCPLGLARSFIAGTAIGDAPFAAGGVTNNYDTTTMTEGGPASSPPPPTASSAASASSPSAAATSAASASASASSATSVATASAAPGQVPRAASDRAQARRRRRLKIRRGRCATGKISRVHSPRVGRVLRPGPAEPAPAAREASRSI